MSEAARRLNDIANGASAVIPEGVDTLIVLAVRGASTSRITGGEALARSGPEIIGTLLKALCDNCGIQLTDAMQRLQDSLWGREKQVASVSKATTMAVLKGGPLDGHVVELLSADTMIQVPFTATGWGHTKSAAYEREGWVLPLTAGKEAAAVVHYHYGNR